jgi:hypothetical protein
VRKELLHFLMAEFDSGRDFLKTDHVLRAIRWGFMAWEAVETETIIKCWAKGIKPVSILRATRLFPKSLGPLHVH